MKRWMLFSTMTLALVACSGGGGGGTTGGGGSTLPVGPAPTATPAPTPTAVSGDMLALVPSRGWNYHSQNVSPAQTMTLYADPSLVNGVRALIASGVTGTVPTVATSAAAMDAYLVGALGIVTDGSYNATVVSELSAGGLAQVPGSPLLVPGTLGQGQSWTPYPGATATVIAVGAMPNASACPVPANGAQVRYTFAGYDYTIAYVPGCGITDFRNNYNAAELELVSVASYAELGELAERHRIQRADMVDTARTALGMGRIPLRALPGLSTLLAGAR